MSWPTPKKKPKRVRQRKDQSETLTRATCIAAVVLNDGNINDTARRLNINRDTLGDLIHHPIWAEDRRMAEQLIEVLTRKMEQVAEKLLGGIEDKIPDASLRDAAYAFDIISEKMRLFRGETTSAPGISDADKLDRIQQIVELARQRSLPPARQAQLLESRIPVEPEPVAVPVIPVSLNGVYSGE